MPLVFGHVDRRRRLPGRAVVGEHHLDAPWRRRVLRRIAGRPAARLRLVDVELVRIHRALHDGLAEPVRRRDEHDLVEARLGVEREHHAGGAQVAAHHPLDAGRQRDVRVREALVDAIGDRAIVVERLANTSRIA